MSAIKSISSPASAFALSSANFLRWAINCSRCFSSNRSSSKVFIPYFSRSSCFARSSGANSGLSVEPPSTDCKKAEDAWSETDADAGGSETVLVTEVVVAGSSSLACPNPFPEEAFFLFFLAASSLTINCLPYRLCGCTWRGTNPLANSAETTRARKTMEEWLRVDGIIMESS